MLLSILLSIGVVSVGGRVTHQNNNVVNDSLRLATFVDSFMVLQREPQAARIWGWAKPGAKITAILNDNKEVLAVDIAALSDGAWILEFPPQPVGAGHTLQVTDGNTTITLDHIAFGDVFLCSGQSNMEMSVGTAFNARQEVDDAIHYPNLRLATVAKVTSDVPMDDVASRTGNYIWAPSSPEAVTENGVFSATCYFFGRDLYVSLNGTVPIGLLVSCWGGQKIETFSSAEALADETCGGTLPGPRPSSDLEDSSRKEGLPSDLKPSTLYDELHSFDFGEEGDSVDSMQIWNAMIHPLLPMRFTAAVWYQGESNADDAIAYACRFPAMITDWRLKFNLPDLSFVYVQLAGMSGQTTWPSVRASQGAALELPAVGMATAIDLGDPDSPYGSIHPRRKQEVGRRLALTMRAIQYKDSDAQHSYTGPVLAGVRLDSNPTHSSIMLSFQTGTADTLHLAGAAGCSTCCQDAPFFVLDASSGNWTRVAVAEVRNTDEIRLFTTAAEVFGIRYAWEPQPECILYNGVGGPDDHGGLAASPFEWCAYPSGKPDWTNLACQVPTSWGKFNTTSVLAYPAAKVTIQR